MSRQVFFSFEFKKDAWRAGQVRNMGKVDKSSTFSDNDWETVKSKDDDTIKKWINDQMKMRSCLVVLIGETTYSRKWVKYEIERAYKLGKGIVGIYVHGLKDSDGKQSSKGNNPFDYVKNDKGKKLSDYIYCYDPPYKMSQNVYDAIERNIETLIEEAIENKDY